METNRIEILHMNNSTQNDTCGVHRHLNMGRVASPHGHI